MAIEKVLSNCKLSDFRQLFLSQKEYNQQRIEWIKGSKSKLNVFKVFIPERGLMATLKEAGLRLPAYLLNDSGNSVHAFIGRKEKASEFFDAILWGKYDGIHIFASQQGDNLVLKFVPSMEYYKLRRGIMTVGGFFVWLVPGFILAALFLWAHNNEKKDILQKIIPGIIETLEQNGKSI